MRHVDVRGGLTWELGHKAPVRMYLGREKNKMQTWKENSEVSSGLTCNVLWLLECFSLITYEM